MRDLSTSLEKHVTLEMTGKETELDKTLIEAIKDPLTHIVRNSVDHGIESPEDRVAAGKPEGGVLTFGRIRIDVLHPGGYMMLGSSENLLGIDNSFERISTSGGSCYQVPRDSAAQA